MSRREDLIEIFKNVNEDKKQLVLKLIDEVVFLENKIKEVKGFPLYRISKDTGRVYPLDNLKIYKELSNQYNLDIKTLATFLNKNSDSELSPLEKFLESQNNN